MKLAISFALVAATALAASPQPLHFHFETNDNARAIYQIACLTGDLPCSSAAFEKTPADQQELDAWSAIFSKVAAAALPPEPAPYLPNSRALVPAVAAQHRILAAALETRSLPDFQSRTWQWMENADSARLFTVIGYFRARLPPSERHDTKSLEKEMRQNGSLPQMEHFYEASLPSREIYVHLIPNAAPAAIAANHIFLPTASAPLLVQQLARFFYNNAPPQKHAAMMLHFAQSGAPEASSLYALLDNTLASDPSFAPLVKDALARGATLFQPEFANAYIRQMTAETAANPRDPKFVFNSAAFIPTARGAAGYELFIRQMPPLSSLKSDQWGQFSNANLVFLMGTDEIGTLRESIPELASYAGKRGFAYIASGAGGRTICVLAGADSTAIVEVVKAFAQLKSLPVTGLALTLN